MGTLALTRVAIVTSLVLAASSGAGQVAHLHLRKPSRGFQMRVTPFEIPPGTERETCEYRTTPNREPMDVQRFQLRMPAGGHHFVVWEYLGTDHNPADFWTGLKDAPGCAGLGPRDSFANLANLFGMQTARGALQFPPGVAVRLEPHAIVYLNPHLRNFSTTKPLRAEAVFNMIPARRGTVRHHAQTFVLGSPDINIPAGGKASLTSEWHAPVDINFVQISTHQHHLGTHTSVHQVDAAGNDMGELFAADNWYEPGERWFSPTYRLLAGEGIRYTCEWENPQDHAVHFGVTTQDEMCFVGGFFYPDDESTVVHGPGCFPQGTGLLCFTPGKPS